MENKKGFTLIELLATVALLGIITTIATMTINKLVKSSKGNVFYKSAQVIKLTANSLCASKKSFKANDIKKELNADGIKIEIVGKEIYVQYENDSKYSNLELKDIGGDFTKLTDGYKFTINDGCTAKTSTTESENYNEVDMDIEDDTTDDDIDLLDVFYGKTKIVNSITEDICKDVEDEILDTDLIKKIEEKAKSNDELNGLVASDIGIFGLEEYSNNLSKTNNSYSAFEMGLKKSDDNLNNEFDDNVSPSNYNILVYVKKNGIFNDLYEKDLNDIFKKRYNHSNYAWNTIILKKLNSIGKSNFNVEKMSITVNKEDDDSTLEKYYGLSFKTSCKVKTSSLNQASQGPIF